MKQSRTNWISRSSTQKSDYERCRKRKATWLWLCSILARAKSIGIVDTTCMWRKKRIDEKKTRMKSAHIWIARKVTWKRRKVARVRQQPILKRADTVEDEYKYEKCTDCRWMLSSSLFVFSANCQSISDTLQHLFVVLIRLFAFETVFEHVLTAEPALPCAPHNNQLEQQLWIFVSI